MSDVSASVLYRRLDRLPMGTRFFVILMIATGLVNFVEYALINTFNMAAPALIKYWHISPGIVGQVVSANFFGMFLGSLLGGWMMDLFGRRPLLRWSVIIATICCLANAIVANVAGLLALRFLTGFFGSIMLIDFITIIAETFPRSSRGRYQALALGLGGFSIPILAFYSRYAVGLGADGWRWIFIAVGIAGIVCTIVSFLCVKETVRWYCSKGMFDKAEAIVAEIEAQAKLPPFDDKEAAAEVNRDAESRKIKTMDLGALFRQGQTRYTIVLIVTWMCSIVGYYGFQSWVPTLLYSQGISLTTSLAFTTVIMLGLPLGGLAAVFFSDRFGRKNSLVVVVLCCVIIGILYGISRAPALVMILGFLMAFALNNQTAYLYAYTPENFPTNIRSTGVGLSNAMGRLAGVFGPLVIAAIFKLYGYPWVFTFIAGMFLIEMLVVWIWGRQTKGSLEEITEKLA